MDDSSGDDAASPPPPRPAPAPARPGPPPARGGPGVPGGQGGRPDRPSDRGQDRGRRGPGRPTPVRAGVEQAPRDPPAPIQTPLRPLAIEGVEWIVREAGRSSSGIGMDSPAALVLLWFCRAADPDRPEREILTPARRLDDLADLELEQLFGASRPFRAPAERQEVFPDTRKRGGKGM